MKHHFIEPYITADKLLRIFETNRIRMAIHEIEFIAKGEGCEPNNIRAALKQLDKDGYIQIDGNLNDWYIRTGIGASFLNNGGYDRHFINLNFSEEKDEDLASMTYQKTIIDLENAKRVYKTYPSTRFMAITATIVSIILLFLKLAEVFGWIKKQ